MNTTGIKLTLCIWFVTSFLAMGTPERELKVDERVIGSNATGFITLRTEVDNLGSYYKFRTKRFLVEYAKLPADAKYEESLGAELKSEVLLDVTTTYDADKSGEEYTASKSETVNTQNQKINLAELLLRFPDLTQKWDDRELAKLSSQSTGGIYIGRVCIVWGGWIKERFCGNPNAPLEWKLTEVYEDANCLYLSVSTEDHGQRIVSVPPRKTRQVRDQITKLPVYLIAGKFKSSDEAIEMGRKLIEKTQGKFAPEVWTYKSAEIEIIYALADRDSTDHLGGNHYEALESLTGVHFTAMSSELFDERILVNPAK